MPSPSTNRATTSQTKFGAAALASAPVIMISATVTYTFLRPMMSARRPKTIAPMKAARIAAPVTQLVCVVDRFHCFVTGAAGDGADDEQVVGVGEEAGAGDNERLDGGTGCEAPR